VSEGLHAPTSLALEFPSDAASLLAARDRVRRHLHDLGVDERASYAVDLSLEELAGNTLRYGYDAGVEGSMRVGVSVAANSVRLSIADDARPFDPTRHPDPGPSRRLGDANVGGRGIAMVRRAVRTMRYHREARGNRIDLEIPRGTAPA
jgi:anti-sigma regulatory factor (Ser/Thr protein kinase)